MLRWSLVLLIRALDHHAKHDRCLVGCSRFSRDDGEMAIPMSTSICEFPIKYLGITRDRENDDNPACNLSPAF